MKDVDFLLFKKFTNDVVYTGIGYKDSTRNRYYINVLQKRVEEILKGSFSLTTTETNDAPKNLKGDGMQIFIPSNIINIGPDWKFC